MFRTATCQIIACLCWLASFAVAADEIIFENVTLIDGNGGKPVRGAYVTIAEGRIMRISSRAPGSLAEDAQRIDGRGKFLVPGFIDTNVHASVYGNSRRRETAVKYADRNHELAEEFAQR